MGPVHNGTSTPYSWYTVGLIHSRPGTQWHCYPVGHTGAGIQWDWYTMGLVQNETGT